MDRAKKESDPDADATIAGTVVATCLVVGGLTIIGLVLGYLAALLVVKLGVPAPKLIVALPLVAVLPMAWALANTSKIRDTVLAVVTATLIALALFALADPSHPSTLFVNSSEVVDVDVNLERDTAEFRLKTTTTLEEIPDLEQMLVLAALLATLSLGLFSLIRPFYEAQKEKKQARGF